MNLFWVVIIDDLSWMWKILDNLVF